MDKKELKKKYRETVRPMGMFIIRNERNCKVFIGSGTDLTGSINSNRFQLKNGLHQNKDLQKEYQESGGEGFSFEILDRLEPREGEGNNYRRELKELESLWMEKLQPYGDKGYHKS